MLKINHFEALIHTEIDYKISDRKVTIVPTCLEVCDKGQKGMKIASILDRDSQKKFCHQLPW